MGDVELLPETLLCIILFALTIVGCAYYFRSCLSRMVFNDDTFNISGFVIINCICFQCCNLCSFEWTRWISGRCCSPDWQGRNLALVMAEYFGIQPRAIRISNIITGGLLSVGWSPFNNGVDLFVKIDGNELVENISTEVVQDAALACTQFTSSLTILVRDSIFDQDVTFSLCKRELLGHSVIASVLVPAVVLRHWMSNGHDVPVRLALQLRDGKSSSVPWMYLQLCQVEEMSVLRKDGTFHAVTNAALSHKSHKLNDHDEENGHDEEEQKIWNDTTSLLSSCTPTPRDSKDIPQNDIKAFQKKFPLWRRQEQEKLAECCPPETVFGWLGFFRTAQILLTVVIAVFYILEGDCYLKYAIQVRRENFEKEGRSMGSSCGTTSVWGIGKEMANLAVTHLTRNYYEYNTTEELCYVTPEQVIHACWTSPQTEFINDQLPFDGDVFKCHAWLCEWRLKTMWAPEIALWIWLVLGLSYTMGITYSLYHDRQMLIACWAKEKEPSERQEGQQGHVSGEDR